MLPNPDRLLRRAGGGGERHVLCLLVDVAAEGPAEEETAKTKADRIRRHAIRPVIPLGQTPRDDRDITSAIRHISPSSLVDILQQNGIK